MNPTIIENLKRLLTPEHIAVFGGRDAEQVISECRRIGYNGHIWPVNPHRESISGIKAFSSVQDLPQAPDASFIAVPAAAALNIVDALNKAGGGGVVCYTAGFGDDGYEGGKSDAELISVAGDLALVGPNCYGVINYLDKVALWPFEHGGYCPGFGAAIVTQSGMLSSDITMNQRSLPLAYMISAGNQSVLQLEDYIEFLCEREEVRAIGLHIEGLRDIAAFSRAALKCLSLNKPIVALKTGTSKKGSQLTLSHTGSMAGSDELYLALFEKLAIIAVDSPANLIETLKFLCVSEAPTGNKMTAFTCSGGGASMIADYAEKIGISLEDPGADVNSTLTELLPAIATVSNPLDYTTPIWGQPEKTGAVFKTALSDPCDVALLLQDYPLPDIDTSKQYYLNDAGAFAEVCNTLSLPAVICSTLPENIDKSTREFLIRNKVSPLQGIHEGLDAIMSGINYSGARERALAYAATLLPRNLPEITRQLDEAHAKSLLGECGLDVPAGQVATKDNIATIAESVGFPVVLKLNSDSISHKTDLGAVVLNVNNVKQASEAAALILNRVRSQVPENKCTQFLVEKMMAPPVAELVIGISNDPQFGLVLTLGSGGIMVELVGDCVKLILPASDQEISRCLSKLKIDVILRGFRNAQSVDRQHLIGEIQRVIAYAIDNQHTLADLELNPLFVYVDRVVAVDVLLHQTRG